MADYNDYQWLIESSDARRLLRDLAHDSSPLHQRLSRLRRSFSASRAAILVEQIELRRRAAAKFGSLAAEMFFTERSLQQASSLALATYKANRFGRGRARVDYCCGIGGDLLALAQQGAASGWDQSHELVLLANANLSAAGLDRSARAQQGNAEEKAPQAGDWWHVDPDRRQGGRRTTRPELHSPNSGTISGWLDTSPHGAVKLAPSCDPLPMWEDVGELEWISHQRECKQLVAWFGSLALAPGCRRATHILTNHPDPTAPSFVTFVGNPLDAAACSGEIQAYIFDLNPALRAARLSDSFACSTGLERVSQGASYFTASEPLDHGLVSCFRVEEALPFRLKSLISLLHARDIGHLEIKTLGTKQSPEQLRPQLKLKGDYEATLLISTLGKKEIAVLASRLPTQG